MDFPGQPQMQFDSIWTYSWESVGPFLTGIALSVASITTVATVAGTIYLYPFVLLEPKTAHKMGIYNSTTVAGNGNLGIYDNLGNNVAETGSTAKSGASALQVINLSASVELMPGRYYMASAQSNSTSSHFGVSNNDELVLSAAPVVTAAGSSDTLSSTITFAASADASPVILMMCVFFDSTL